MSLNQGPRGPPNILWGTNILWGYQYPLGHQHSVGHQYSLGHQSRVRPCAGAWRGDNILWGTQLVDWRQLGYQSLAMAAMSSGVLRSDADNILWGTWLGVATFSGGRRLLRLATSRWGTNHSVGHQYPLGYEHQHSLGGRCYSRAALKRRRSTPRPQRHRKPKESRQPAAMRPLTLCGTPDRGFLCSRATEFDPSPRFRSVRIAMMDRRFSEALDAARSAAGAVLSAPAWALVPYPPSRESVSRERRPASSRSSNIPKRSFSTANGRDQGIRSRGIAPTQAGGTHTCSGTIWLPPPRSTRTPPSCCPTMMTRS